MDTTNRILPCKKPDGYEELGKEILFLCKNEICARYPFWNRAFAALPLQWEAQMDGIGTDGNRLKAAPLFLVQNYGICPGKIKRGFLHILFHCLYLHPFSAPKPSRRKWDLACDLASEFLIADNLPGNLWQEPWWEKKKKYLDFLRENLGKEIIPSAELIYGILEKEELPFSVEELEETFFFDDHSLWKRNPRGSQLPQKWERILVYTLQGREKQKHRAGNMAGNKEEEIQEIYASRYDYRKFLKKFAFSREEIQLDEESFDYIFYHYGMEHYGNLPLIEPLEYKEVNRLEELVIAIDTSGSCKRELVQQFLGETYKILSTRENFFKKMEVYILQCDCCIQDAVVIHSEEDWKKYAQNIKIQGRGGTDFRPVFRFIKKEQEKKKLQNLKALIYFTDGDGIYPREKPDYETAFVFVKKTENMKFVPGWACKLVIGQRSI